MTLAKKKGSVLAGASFRCARESHAEILATFSWLLPPRAGDGSGLGAGSIEAEGGGVAEIVDGSGEGGDVTYIVVAWILAVEEIEEFGEGAELDSFSQIDVAADAEIDLIEGSPAELVKGGLRAVDYGAIVAREAVVINVGGRGDGEGPSAFKLGEGRDFEAPRKLQRSD